MSQLCLTGLRADLCGLMLRAGGWPPDQKTHRHTHRGGGGERGAARRQSGHGVLGNMSASFDTAQPYMKISLCYQETASLRRCNNGRKEVILV